MLFIIASSIAQKNNSNIVSSRWEASVGSGLYFDLFYADVLSGSEDYIPQGYPNKKAKDVNIGVTDRIEIKYLFNKKSALSLYFQNSRYRDLFGIGNDPLAAWTEAKRSNRRMHFTLNYYRMFKSGKIGTWSIASGFQVQIEKVSFPYYIVDNPNNPTAIIEIGAIPHWSYFEDWAIPLTVAHHWTVNKNLKLGLILNTAYTTGTGVDGLSLLGSIAIPFGKEVKNKKKK